MDNSVYSVDLVNLVNPVYIAIPLLKYIVNLFIH